MNKLLACSVRITYPMQFTTYGPNAPCDVWGIKSVTERIISVIIVAMSGADIKHQAFKEAQRVEVNGCSSGTLELVSVTDYSSYKNNKHLLDFDFPNIDKENKEYANT